MDKNKESENLNNCINLDNIKNKNQFFDSIVYIFCIYSIE